MSCSMEELFGSVFQLALKFSDQLYQLGKFSKNSEQIENHIPNNLESVEVFIGELKRNKGTPNEGIFKQGLKMFLIAWNVFNC